MATYSPAVEQWRSLVQQYFHDPALVDKWLYLINGESGGNPKSVGDGGAAHGLFQSHHLGENAANSTPQQQMEDAVRLWENDRANGGQGFRDWGDEGNTYQGKPFGALGNHPYGGAPPANTGVPNNAGAPAVGAPVTGAGGKAVDATWLTKYATVYTQWKPLQMKLQGYTDNTGKPLPDIHLVPNAEGGLDAIIPQFTATAGGQTQTMKTVPIFSAAEYASYINLDTQLTSLEAQQDPQSLDDAIKQATFSYNSDPRNIDADNAAKKYARELSATNSAITLAAKNQDAQTANQKDSMDSFNGPRGNIASFYAPQTHPQSPDSIYKDAVDTVKKNLPDVPDAPYYDPAQRGAATTPHTPFDPTDLQAQIDAEAAAKRQATIATTQSTHVPADPFAGSTPQDGGPTSFAGRIPSASMPPAGPWNPGDWAMGRIRGSIFHQSGAAPAAPTPAAPTMLAPPSVPRVAPRPFSFQAFGGAGR